MLSDENLEDKLKNNDKSLWNYLDDNPKEAWNVYKKLYSNLSKSELHKEDYKLYEILRKNKLTKKIPHKRKRHFGKNPLDYYHKHYEGLSKSEVQKKDSYYYTFLLKKGLTKKIPKKVRVTGKDLLKECKKKYGDISPKDLREKNYSLYQRMWDKGVLEQITVKAPWTKKPLEYYHKNYENFTRGQLEKENNSFYSYLSRHNLLKNIPTKIIDYGKNPLDYYHKHYKGLSPSELRKENQSYYVYLLRRNLTNKLPRKKYSSTRRNFKGKYLEYYNEHYSGLTRSQLEKKDLYLYQTLSKKGLLEKIPK